MFSGRVALAFFVLNGAAVAQQYVISTYAGGAPPPTPIAGMNAPIASARGVAVDTAGNVFFTTSDLCVFKLDRNGILTRVAGNSRLGYSGDGGPAINAQFTQPWGVAVDSTGNIYVADAGWVRRISTDGSIRTVAGGGTSGPGDGGQAVNAQLNSAYGVAVDVSGNLFIVDAGAAVVRRVSSTGIITTVAGNGIQGYSGDGGQATSAELQAPVGVAVDSSGNLYIADKSNERIRKVSPNGIITTVAGNGGLDIHGGSGDGGPATSAQLSNPDGVAVDSAGNLYIAQDGDGVRKVTSGGIISTVISNVGANGVAPDNAGNLYLATGSLPDMREYRSGGITRVSPVGAVTQIAGNGTVGYSGDGGPAIKAQIIYPKGVAVDGTGNLYIIDAGNFRIRRVSTGGTITTVAGDGSRPDQSSGILGDGGLAINAQLGDLTFAGIAIDASGNLFLCANSRVRKVTTAGIITTIAGNGTAGYSGDGGSATSAQLGGRCGLAMDSGGNLYIADSDNDRVRKISPAGTITTIAGNGTDGISGDGGPAINAQIGSPFAVAVDPLGNVYIGTTYSIRKVSPSGTITTSLSYSVFECAGSLAVDKGSNVYYGQTSNCSSSGGYIRKIFPTGVVTTVGGNGTHGYSGDGGPASNAQMSSIVGLAVDASGNIYAADQENYAVRLLQPTGPPLSISSVTNGASNRSGPISPGEIVVLYGSGLGPGALVNATVGSNGLYPTQLAGTSVQVNGISAPMIYTWATQVAAVVPYGISGTTAQVAVTYQGQTTLVFSAPVAASSPGIFSLDSTGTGQAAAVNQDGFTLNTAANPAKIGDVISLYATGEGQTTPSGVDGKPASVPLPQPNLPVTVTIGGQTVKPQYAGGAPGEVAGVMQVNAQIPSGIQTGNTVPVVVLVGGIPSQAGVTIAVH